MQFLRQEAHSLKEELKIARMVFFIFISSEMYCENNRTPNFSQERLIFHKNCTRLSSSNN